MGKRDLENFIARGKSDGSQQFFGILKCFLYPRKMNVFWGVLESACVSVCVQKY